MNWVMRRLCPGLATLPIGPSRPDRTAGPGLEMARPDYFVLPHRQAAWKIISERLGVLTEACATIAQEPGLAALSDLANHLRSMAGDVRAHLDESRARSLRPRLAKPECCPHSLPSRGGQGGGGQWDVIVRRLAIPGPNHGVP